MKFAVFGTRSFDKTYFEQTNKKYGFELTFFDEALNEESMLKANGYDAVCTFPGDVVNQKVINNLFQGGVKIISTRSAGYDHIDIETAQEVGIPVVNVPAYSPHSIAEHAMAMLLTLNRKIHIAHKKILKNDFSIDDLIGFDLFGKTAGVIGTGTIGACFCDIALGFGCRVLAYDIKQNEELKAKGVEFVTFDELVTQSDFISLHTPLNQDTKYMLDRIQFDQMKENAYLINTGRGGLVNTTELIVALHSNKIKGAALDVYEKEEGIFFNDLSNQELEDTVLKELLQIPNVLITAHQAFLTEQALSNISETTFENIQAFNEKSPLINEIY